MFGQDTRERERERERNRGEGGGERKRECDMFEPREPVLFRMEGERVSGSVRVCVCVCESVCEGGREIKTEKSSGRAMKVQ